MGNYLQAILAMDDIHGRLIVSLHSVSICAYMTCIFIALVSFMLFHNPTVTEETTFKYTVSTQCQEHIQNLHDASQGGITIGTALFVSWCHVDVWPASQTFLMDNNSSRWPHGCSGACVPHDLPTIILCHGWSTTHAVQTKRVLDKEYPVDIQAPGKNQTTGKNQPMFSRTR